MLIQIFPHKLITIDKIVGGTEAVYDTAFPHIFYFGPGPFLCVGIWLCCHTIDP